MKIYTRTGDDGTTALFDGTRIAKSDPRVRAYGDLDEANAVVGLARSMGPDADIDEMLVRIQRDLFAVGSRLADPRFRQGYGEVSPKFEERRRTAERIADRISKVSVGDEDVARLERWIDACEAELTPLRRFILPGGSQLAATLHLARTVCRRAERRIVALGMVEPVLLVYVNRLSDLLFVMARVVNHRAKMVEAEW
jgi:cob(I)alamin adenosyltransferase